MRRMDRFNSIGQPIPRNRVVVPFDSRLVPDIALLSDNELVAFTTEVVQRA